MEEEKEEEEYAGGFGSNNTDGVLSNNNQWLELRNEGLSPEVLMSKSGSGNPWVHI